MDGSENHGSNPFAATTALVNLSNEQHAERAVEPHLINDNELSAV